MTMNNTSLITSNVTITDQQIERLFSFLRHHVQESDIHKDRFEQILNSFDRLNVAGSIVNLLEGKAWHLAKAMPLSVNYDEPNALEVAIKERPFRFEFKDGLSFEDIPLGRKGFAKYEVAIKSFSRPWNDPYVYFHNLADELAGCGLQSVDPLTALRYVMKNRQFFEISPVFVLFISNSDDLCAMGIYSRFSGEQPDPVRVFRCFKETGVRAGTNILVRALDRK